MVLLLGLKSLKALITETDVLKWRFYYSGTVKSTYQPLSLERCFVPHSSQEEGVRPCSAGHTGPQWVGQETKDGRTWAAAFILLPSGKGRQGSVSRFRTGSFA